MKSLPVNMLDLPIDDKGRPVPWFVQWVNEKVEPVPMGKGRPEFRAMDPFKFLRAVKEKLCWVCGKKLGVNVTFVIGPMCGINRISSEPPSHYDCAVWSAINCPFLSNPRMVRREDEIMDNQRLRDNAAGVALTRNPGVTLLWNTRQFEVIKVDNGYLFQIGEPESMIWYREGRIATKEEISQSIESGLPSLEATARQQPGGMELLKKMQTRFERLIGFSL